MSIRSLLHKVVDDGAGGCSSCGRRTSDYGLGLQHRRGRRHDSPRCAPILAGPRLKCRSCGRVRVRLRRFTLSFREEIAERVFRRDAGATMLCQACWRRLTTLAPPAQTPAR